METETLEQKQRAVIDLVSSELRPVLTPEFFVDRSKQEADRLRAEKLNEEARMKAEFWNVCPTCLKKSKVLFIDKRKKCHWCRMPMRPLKEEFGESALAKAREELEYRRQLRNEATERWKTLSSVADTPTIAVSEGNHKEASKERGA
jgi:hypothetical protein